ncbi:MAG: TIGR03960 family B12-binding radical SAM protein [Candidatus Muiribacteriota bacterium]
MEKKDPLLREIANPARYFPCEFGNAKKSFKNSELKVCISYPDAYEVGMSNLGLRILYSIANSVQKVVCDRIFAPFPDMAELYRSKKFDFVSIEHKKPLKDFDIVGFSFQYELLYTNFLNILDLSDIPPEKDKREEETPLIIAGGPAMMNPAIMMEFADFIFIGEAEESFNKFLKKVKKLKKEGNNKIEIISKIKNEDGILNCHFPQKTKRTYIKDLNFAPFPDNWIVPVNSIVHDRIFLEIMRGCVHGCRFCQAGYIYRPIRYKNFQTLKKQSKQLLEKTGYDEISLISLSTGDYPDIKKISEYIADNWSNKKVSLSLPSLHVNSKTLDILQNVLKVKKTGLTFACEAGAQSLRNKINKKISNTELIEKVTEVFKKGWLTIKLYFMIGLPFEKEDDLIETVKLISECSKIARNYGGKRAKINVAFSTFIPKPFTPFQWSEMLSLEEINNKLNFLRKNLNQKNVRLKYNSPNLSVIEGIFSRGDSELSEVLLEAYRLGALFDGWSEWFKYEIWKQAFENKNINMEKYLKKIPVNQELPWDIVDNTVNKEFFINELQKAEKEEKTQDCKIGLCKKCGVC